MQKKVGILTFHDGINHGGYLQAFATATYLRNRGLNAYIIHYRNRRHLIREYTGLLIRYNPKNIIRNLLKIRVFKRAQRRMPLTAFTLSRQRVAEMGFEAIVFGSDIIWNFSWKDLGQDLIYFGQGLESSKMVAYAPSLGAAAGLGVIPPYIVKCLQKFDALSVRDEESLQLLQHQGLNNVQLVLDPTLLIDWKAEIKQCRLPERFLLVYAFQLRPEEIIAAREYAVRHGLKTVAIGYPQRWCDFQKAWADPFEFLYCFQTARAILTSTFHGTLFAIQFEQPFYTSCNPPIENKTRGFLRGLELEHRLSTHADLVADSLETRPDYRRVGRLLDEQRTKSKTFLSNALELPAH